MPPSWPLLAVLGAELRRGGLVVSPAMPGSAVRYAGSRSRCSMGGSRATNTCACWDGTPNTSPQAIGGGFIWAYASIEGSSFLAYMNALKNGLGM
jgi:hypothetical protein